MPTRRAPCRTAWTRAIRRRLHAGHRVEPPSRPRITRFSSAAKVVYNGLMARSRLESAVRSAAAYATLGPAMLGGVAVGAIKRDRNAIAEFGVNTWVDGMLGITGVRLRVTGEEHLRSARPAVFLFNHRNNFDPYVAIKLIRTDWGSVAKKEI